MAEKQKEFFEDIESKLRGLGNRMSQMFEDFRKKGTAEVDLEVAADAFRHKENMVFEVDLPGFKKEDVKVQVVDNHLMIRGKRERSEISQEGDYHMRERSFGMFERSFALPPSAMAEKTKAKFENGVLIVTIPLDDYEIEEQEVTIE